MTHPEKNDKKKVKGNPADHFQVSEDIISLGFPINPKLKNTLFPNNYVLTNNLILEKKLDELQGCVLELHFQSMEDFTELYDDEKNELRDYVKFLKSKNFKFMIHHPFVTQTGKNFFEMDYSWLTVPNKYKSGENYASKIGGVKNYAWEMDINVSKQFLEFTDFLGIRNLTLHASKSGIFLDEKDFHDYKLKIEELVNFIQKKSLDVEIAVETGGITPEQLLELHDKYNTNINLDTAHMVLDLKALHHELSHFTINDQITKFFKKNHSFITQLHLNQTKIGDQHLPINEDGIVTCNKDILRLINKYKESGQTFLAMIESRITDKDLIYIKHAISEVEYFGYGNAVANIVMGWPLSGKTTGSKVLHNMIGKVLASDEMRLFYVEAMSQEHVVPEEEKNRVYNDLLDRLGLMLKKGNPESNIEATFSLKSRRDRLFNILNKHLLKDVYIWNFTRNEDDTKKRIEKRAREKKKIEDNGEKYPENILADYNIYKEFMLKDTDNEKPTVFSIDEIPADLMPHVHVLTYNTSTQEMTKHNPDETLEKCAKLLAESAKKV